MHIYLRLIGSGVLVVDCVVYHRIAFGFLVLVLNVGTLYLLYGSCV